MNEKIPVFICYRQKDALKEATAIYELVKGQELCGGIELDPYFDRSATPTDDWTKIHLPSLKLSHALIYVMSPEANLRKDDKDWVWEELEWWLKNRDLPPIVIDSFDMREEHIPSPFKKSQRIKIELTEGKLEKNEQLRVKSLLLRAIKEDEIYHLYNELNQEKKVRRLLSLSTLFSTVAALVSLAVIYFSISAYSNLNRQISEAKDELRQVENGYTKIYFSASVFETFPNKYSKKQIAEIDDRVIHSSEKFNQKLEQLNTTPHYSGNALLRLRRELNSFKTQNVFFVERYYLPIFDDIVELHQTKLSLRIAEAEQFWVRESFAESMNCLNEASVVASNIVLLQDDAMFAASGAQRNTERDSFGHRVLMDNIRNTQIIVVEFENTRKR